MVFLGGFRSDMTGAKATSLEALCRDRGQAFLRFDYRGHGASSGRFEDGCIGDWAADALTAFDRLTQGPQILVGSSMGGWIALLTALRRAARVAGLVAIAPAPDFTEDLMWAAIQKNPERSEELMRDGAISSLSGDYRITRRLIEDGRRHLLLRAPIALNCPVRILHGQRDDSVPWRRSLDLAEKLTSADIRTVFVKDGDHRLSRDSDLTLIAAAVSELLD